MHKNIAVCLTEVPAGVKATAHYLDLARQVAARGNPPVFGSGVLHDLHAELGEFTAVWQWVRETATAVQKPVFCNLAIGDDSKTVVLAPDGWTADRLEGFTAGLHAELEAAFGRVTHIGKHAGRMG